MIDELATARNAELEQYADILESYSVITTKSNDAPLNTKLCRTSLLGLSAQLRRLLGLAPAWQGEARQRYLLEHWSDDTGSKFHGWPDKPKVASDELRRNPE